MDCFTCCRIEVGDGPGIVPELPCSGPLHGSPQLTVEVSVDSPPDVLGVEAESGVLRVRAHQDKDPVGPIDNLPVWLNLRPKVAGNDDMAFADDPTTPFGSLHMVNMSRDRIATRQVDTLIGLAKGIVLDGIVDQREAEFLRDWLVANHAVLDNPVNGTLMHRVGAMLEDNVLDADEAAEPGDPEGVHRGGSRGDRGIAAFEHAAV